MLTSPVRRSDEGHPPSQSGCDLSRDSKVSYTPGTEKYHHITVQFKMSAISPNRMRLSQSFKWKAFTFLEMVFVSVIEKARARVLSCGGAKAASRHDTRLVQKMSHFSRRHSVNFDLPSLTSPWSLRRTLAPWRQTRARQISTQAYDHGKVSLTHSVTFDFTTRTERMFESCYLMNILLSCLLRESSG